MPVGYSDLTSVVRKSRTWGYDSTGWEFGSNPRQGEELTNISWEDCRYSHSTPSLRPSLSPSPGGEYVGIR